MVVLIGKAAVQPEPETQLEPRRSKRERKHVVYEGEDTTEEEPKAKSAKRQEEQEDDAKGEKVPGGTHTHSLS